MLREIEKHIYFYIPDKRVNSKLNKCLFLLLTFHWNFNKIDNIINLLNVQNILFIGQNIFPVRHKIITLYLYDLKCY